MPANSAAQKTIFFPTAETTISQALAQEVPSVSQHHMPRKSLLSAYNRARGREGSCETPVTAAGEPARKEGAAKRTQAGI